MTALPTALRKGALAMLAAATLAVTSMGTASAQTTPDEIVARGKLVVAVSTVAPPYGFVDENNEPAGIDVEIAHLVGKYLNVPVEFVSVPVAGRIPALLSNRADMAIAIFTTTPERALQIAFSNPYAAQRVVVIAPKTTEISDYNDLNGLRVGAIRGQLSDRETGSLDGGGAQTLFFDDIPAQIQAMIAGQIDAMTGGDYGEIYLRKGAQGEEFEAKFVVNQANFGIGVHSDSSKLLHWLNTFLMYTKGTGELDEISRKWREGENFPDLPTF